MGQLLLVLLLTIVRPLIFCRGVTAGLCSTLISPNGYTCYEYQATTDDGFILGIQNIPSTGSPVLLTHGLLSGGDSFVLNSPQQSLAFILSDAGYDVWLGNNRCNRWSHGHTSYNSSSNGYWAWTYDELASYDLATTTEFVYNLRGKLFYIGHSQGTLMLLAGLSGGAYKSQVLGYVQAAVLLAPVASVGNLTPPITKAGLTIYADTILPAIGVQEFYPNIFADFACRNYSIPASVCNNLIANILDSLLGRSSHIDTSRTPIFLQYFPQATSSYNFNHFGQSFRGNSFQFYDKGLLGNLAAYGQPIPPSYDLSAFPSSLPLQIWSGGIDGFADPTDVASLLGKLPSSNRETHYLPSYGHLDFVLSTQANSDIYTFLIDFLQSHA